MECSSLNVIIPHKSIGIDSIRRCGFVEVGMAFLEEVCHGGVDLKASYAQDTAKCISWLPVAF